MNIIDKFRKRDYGHPTLRRPPWRSKQIGSGRRLWLRRSEIFGPAKYVVKKRETKMQLSS
jgi:hypothetical protein